MPALENGDRDRPSETTLKDILKGIYEPIQGEIDRVEDVLGRELAHENPFIGRLLRHSSKFQGKRIRPALLLHCAHILGGVSDVHISLGAVVEMLHNATLVHDDVLDEALLRRKVKTLNEVWGNEASILFGDYLFAKAYALCAKLHNREANLILAHTVDDMCVGELSQIATKFDFDIDEERYLKVIRHKTASLFSAACRLGTVGSGADPRGAESLARYGDNVGMAFQIVDDCLDITGNEQEAGKSLGTDLEKGKLTLPVIKLLRELPPPERRELQELLISSDDAAKKEIVLRLIRERDILGYSLGRAAAFVEEAKSLLSHVHDSVYVENLHALADFILDRRT